MSDEADRVADHVQADGPVQNTVASTVEDAVERVVATLHGLSPEQRRQLLRHLRTSGLLETEELLTDRNRLQIAPALGLSARRRVRRTAAQQREAPREQQPSPQPVKPAPKPRLVTPDPPESYRSSVSGKVVVGSPGSETAPDDPHLMPPLPGQAPEKPIVVIFDGGSKGNPGKGYGSYALRWPGQPQQVVQLRFGDKVTNNEAEYDTLIASLEAILQRLLDAKADPNTARVEIWGDSLLVVNQVKGQWEAKEPRLAMRRDRVRELLERFGRWQLSHHGRENSVRTLGH